MTDANEYYTRDQRLKYMEMTDAISVAWMKVFGQENVDDKTFWDTGYWDLLTKLWRAGKAVKKADALNYIVGKQTVASTRILNTALKEKFITLREPTEDEDQRASMVGLSDEMKQRLDDYFDLVLRELIATADSIRQQNQ